MERITDKLKKLLALAERGCGGEAENARRLLEEHLRKYGMTLEDICENKTSQRGPPFDAPSNGGLEAMSWACLMSATEL